MRNSLSLRHRSLRRIIKAVRPSRFIAGITVGAIAVGGAGLAFGAGPSSSGVISACYRKVGGNVRIIDTSKGATCARSEKPLVWNETGRQGPQGLQGVPGAAGPAGPVGPQGPQGPQGDSTPTTQPPDLARKTQVVARLSGNIVGSPEMADVYTYRLSLGLPTTRTYNPTNQLTLLMPPSRTTDSLLHLTSGHAASTTLQLLRPDGATVATIILQDVSVLSAESDAAGDVFNIAFASASLSTPTADNPASTFPATAAIHLGNTQTSPLAAFSFRSDGSDPVGTSAINLTGALTRPMMEFGAALLNGNLPTSMSVDQLAKDGSTVTRALTFGNVSIKGVTLENQFTEVDGVPVLTLATSYQTIATTIGTTTTCWSYVTGAAC